MHAVFKNPSCARASEMLQERDSELNVMDFVETEYKSDEHEGIVEHSKPRRKSKRQPKVLFHFENEQLNSGRSPSPSPRNTKKYLKKRRKKCCVKSKLMADCDEKEDEVQYPYAMLLKSLCNEVGKVGSAELPGTAKLFKQLHHTSVYYPYASLLQELHETVRKEVNDIPSIDEDNCCDPLELEIAQVLRSVHFKTSRQNESEAQSEVSEGENFEASFSTLLLSMIIEHKIKGHLCGNDSSISGIGRVLNICMGESPWDKPIKEMHSSALLQNLSLLVEKESTDDDSETGNEVAIESSAESIQEEEVEWRPSNWRTENIPETMKAIQKKRKSPRKKKSITKFDAAPEKKKSLGSRSNCNSQPLLQLIFGKGKDDLNVQEAHNKKLCESEVRAEVLKKIKSRIKRQKLIQNTDRRNPLHDDLQTHSNCFRNDKGLSEASEEEQEIEEIGGRVVIRPTEQQSLLKEYLLKPTGEEITSKGNCDIPKVSENSFLFSRLLQNFKAISDNHQCGSGLGRGEESSSSNILREMLIQSCCKPELNPSNSDDETQDVKHFKPMEHLDLSSLQTFSSDRNFIDTEDSLCEIDYKVKHEDDALMTSSNILREMLIRTHYNPEFYCDSDDETRDIKNITLAEHLHISSLENCSSEKDSTDIENGVCEIKCEVKCENEYMEDTYECHICRLQFSSGLDLANHQMLFHCNEEIQTAGPACLHPHGSDNIQKTLFQEKLPA